MSSISHLNSDLKIVNIFKIFKISCICSKCPPPPPPVLNGTNSRISMWSYEYTLYFSPLITWRDVQHLLVKTSRPVHLKASDWKTNAAGHKGNIFIICRNVCRSISCEIVIACNMCRNMQIPLVNLPPPYLCVVSHLYGFGLVDAEAMVVEAKKWRSVPPQHTCTKMSDRRTR